MCVKTFHSNRDFPWAPGGLWFGPSCAFAKCLLGWVTLMRGDQEWDLAVKQIVRLLMICILATGCVSTDSEDAESGPQRETAAAAAVPVAERIEAANKNPGFEEVSDGRAIGWTSQEVEGVSWLVADEAVYAGSHSMMLRGAGTRKEVRLVSAAFPVKPGDCVEVLAWIHVKGTPRRQPRAFVEVKVADNRWVALEPKAHEVNILPRRTREWVWTPRACSVFVPREGEEARLVFSCTAASADSVTWYVDDFECRIASFADYLAANRNAERLEDIVLIGVDTLAQQYVGCYGADWNHTPNIDALAREGRLYKEVTTAASWTKPSFGSILTSRYPSQHTAEFFNSVLPEDLVTLAEALRARGYFTAGFVRSPYDGFLGPGMQLGQGFDLFFYSIHEDLVFEAMRRFLETNLDHLRDMKAGGIFLFWHFFEPHAHYRNDYPTFLFNKGLVGNIALNESIIRKTILSNNPELADEEDVRYVRSCYASEVALVDKRIGDLFARLRWVGLYDRFNILFCADHGESFGEKPGVWNHGHPYITCTQTPLIMRFPGRVDPGRADERSLVSNLDVMPTILSLAGAPIPPGCEGRDLLGRARGQTAKYGICEDKQNGSLSIRDARYKLIANNAATRRTPDDRASARWVLYEPDSPTEYELYDLRTDPLELSDIAQEKPAVFERLKEALDAHCAGVGIGRGEDVRPSPEAPVLSEKTIEELRAQGYL